MKFKVLVKSIDTADDAAWWESYEETTDDADAWALVTIAAFNASLRPREKARKVLKVEILEDNNDGMHDWVKRIDGMSVMFRGMVVDLFHCQKCRITGKRVGLDSYIKIDSKFRGKAFAHCNTARAKMSLNPDKYR